MPIYEYLCPDGHRFDVVQRFSDEPVTVCEVCGKPVQRVLHAPAVHYKGKGFYSTDYGRGGKAANGDKADSGSSSDSGSKESSSSGSRVEELRLRLQVGVEELRLEELGLARARAARARRPRSPTAPSPPPDAARLGAAGGERVAGLGGERRRLARARRG